MRLEYSKKAKFSKTGEDSFINYLPRILKELLNCYIRAVNIQNMKDDNVRFELNETESEIELEILFNVEEANLSDRQKEQDKRGIIT